MNLENPRYYKDLQPPVCIPRINHNINLEKTFIPIKTVAYNILTS